MKVSLATLALLSVSAKDGYENWGISSKNLQPLKASQFAFHYNEDPTSVPAVLSGKKYLTSTEAKLLSHKQTDLASEPEGPNRAYFVPYNKFDNEYLQMSESESESSSDDETDAPRDEVTVLWRVSPDYGELDDHIMGREKDIASGKKESGWSNPLGWSDTGADDDQVVLQTGSKVRFEESGFDTPADTGLGDEMVMNMVQLHDDIPDLNVDVGKLDFSQTDA